MADENLTILERMQMAYYSLSSELGKTSPEGLFESPASSDPTILFGQIGQLEMDVAFRNRYVLGDKK